MTNNDLAALNRYLVGGAVRDKLLGHKVYDHDFVVVGATIEQMLALGFTQVGKDFPVFLHPKTKEEYALARTERKQGQGYTGFICDASSAVTLEEDLLRRDLTINAMAMPVNGSAESTHIIDPYNGQVDLKNRILRHVSSAFVEDPLRVLRVARFTARYHNYGFTIASETLQLMSEISNSGELATLSGERVWQEMQRCLTENNPEVFFQVLRQCGALAKIWPELNSLWGIPNPEKWHPEICSGIHTMMVLQQAVKLSPKTSVRFAALCHDLGKSLTLAENWPSHRGHEKSGLALVDRICEQLKVPKDHKILARKVCEFHLHCHKAFELTANTLVKLFNSLDVWRKPEEFADFLTACTADFRGRLHNESKPYPQADYLRSAFQAALTVTATAFIKQGIQGADIKEAINRERIELVQAVKVGHDHPTG
ncbi:multifunctional CCA addition/repair protein [Colwellia hornerae]|uniref:Multifunctional CCA protein n=1 Tax=Colwellia hornerae TaxID=89402 RepID=A0A5C6QJ49_9GAMM|nr:multifunctional CCA addition/repair protein [Colwellia hornerae]TWX54091.1 multifunctional CCA addition/repair protein [Colwellia hornerae]TWX60866.1 multifunctional CCA addition/repair protein [Colwellia hornerae]TWX69196.1 multifunctional CCA addition/repair protein [Colwellia hornerae]